MGNTITPTNEIAIHNNRNQKIVIRGVDDIFMIKYENNYEIFTAYENFSWIMEHPTLRDIEVALNVLGFEIIDMADHVYLKIFKSITILNDIVIELMLCNNNMANKNEYKKECKVEVETFRLNLKVIKDSNYNDFYDTATYNLYIEEDNNPIINEIKWNNKLSGKKNIKRIYNKVRYDGLGIDFGIKYLPFKDTDDCDTAGLINMLNEIQTKFQVEILHIIFPPFRPTHRNYTDINMRLIVSNIMSKNTTQKKESIREFKGITYNNETLDKLNSKFIHCEYSDGCTNMFGYNRTKCISSVFLLY